MKLKSLFLLVCLTSVLFSCHQTDKTPTFNKLVSSTGNTYYISASGSTTNAGTSETTAWNISRLQTEINKGTIAQGDRMLFKKGDVFTTVLQIGFSGSPKSGTALAPIYMGSYGSGDKPRFECKTKTGAMYIVGMSYYFIEGLNFEDKTFPAADKLTVAPMATGLRIGDFGGTAKSNNFVIKNCDFSNIGLGVVILGDNNLVDSCTFINLKNVVNTDGGYEDYGANPITLKGNYNTFSHCYFEGGWCESFDFGYSGGCVEMYGACNYTKFMYNTVYDVGAIAEYGSDDAASTSVDNLFGYNKIINCGGLSWINFSGPFTTKATNTQFTNNVIIENINSRFSGPNSGAGLTDPRSKDSWSAETFFLGFSSGSPNETIFSLTNNMFKLDTKESIVNGSASSKTKHTNNIYQFSNGASAGFTLDPTEILTSNMGWTNTSSASAVDWDLSLLPTSVAVKKGRDVGLKVDFLGNAVGNPPNMGIIDNGGVVTPPPPPPTCTPRDSTRTIACPVGQTGTITQKCTFMCPDGKWSDWVITSSDCVTPPPPATTLTVTNDANYIYLNSPKQGTYRLYKGTNAYLYYQVKSGSYPTGVSKIGIANFASGIYTFRTNSRNYAIRK